MKGISYLFLLPSLSSQYQSAACFLLLVERTNHYIKTSSIHTIQNPINWSQIHYHHSNVQYYQLVNETIIREWWSTRFFFFVQGISSQSRIFHSFQDVTNNGEGLQILTNSRHSWSLSSKKSLTCHSYSDMGQHFIMVISEDP